MAEIENHIAYQMAQSLVEIEAIKHTKEHCDADRLEWIIRNPIMKVMGSDERGWSVVNCANGLTFMSRGLPTYREAIDAAMDKQRAG